MNLPSLLEPTRREHIRQQAMQAALAQLCTRNRGWHPKSSLDIDELLITLPTPDQPFYGVELYWKKNDKRRRLQWPEQGGKRSEPIMAQLMYAETLIFTLADCFVLLSAAAIAMEHSVDAFYPYFHERYRAHPTGRLELIEDSK